MKLKESGDEKRNAKSSSSDDAKKTVAQTDGASGAGKRKSSDNKTKDDSIVESDPVVVLFDENQVLTIEATETMKKAMAERDMKKYPLHRHEIELLRIMAGTAEENSSFDKNHVLTEVAAVGMKKEFEARDMRAWPLEQHELGIVELMIMDGIHVRESTVGVMEPRLLEKEDGKDLKDHEYRLLGQLAYKGLKAADDGRLSLKSFKYFPPFQIVRIPETKATRTTVKAYELKRYSRHVAIAKKWMSHLPGDFTDELLSSFIKEKPDVARDLIGRYHHNLYRQSPRQTLGMQAYCNLNGNQKSNFQTREVSLLHL